MYITILPACSNDDIWWHEIISISVHLEPMCTHWRTRKVATCLALDYGGSKVSSIELNCSTLKILMIYSFNIWHFSAWTTTSKLLSTKSYHRICPPSLAQALLYNTLTFFNVYIYIKVNICCEMLLILRSQHIHVDLF